MNRDATCSLGRVFRRSVAGVAIAAAFVTTARAQETTEDESRAAQQARLQAEKATELTPEGPSKGERFVIKLMHSGLLGNLPRGVYPWAGSVLGGGGFALGGGYRTPLRDIGSFNLVGGWSVRNFKMADTRLALPVLAHGRVHVDVAGKFIDAPTLGFYGVGNDTSPEARDTYLYRPTRTGASARVAITDELTLGGGMDYLRIHTENEGAFPLETTPGLNQDVDYGVPRAYLAFDWRDAAGYSRRGGLYRVDWATYKHRGDPTLSFHQMNVDLRQFVPLFRENWVLAFRALGVISTTTGENQVPYFLMPYLGSGETLRGFQNRRFTDRNALLLQAEYRWTPSKFVDLALFVDAGKVAARARDLDTRDLHTDFGIGIRFHGPGFTAFRVDLAKGTEGFNLVLAAGIK